LAAATKGEDEVNGVSGFNVVLLNQVLISPVEISSLTFPILVQPYAALQQVALHIT
jgi:hypothetical protein